jgi:hypothetical protein
MGVGCTIGVRKMARISPPISEAELERIVRGYFSIDALQFRDERDLLWYSTVFRSAERELAYVDDGLMHHDVVKSDIYSTDAFDLSELLFGVNPLRGSRMPRCSSGSRASGCMASRVGAGYSDTDLILHGWDEHLRLITTIKLKEVTASDLFRRRNSCPTPMPRRLGAATGYRAGAGSDRARAALHPHRSGFGQTLRCRGSRASRNPSPTRLKASTARKIARPGNVGR